MKTILFLVKSKCLFICFLLIPFVFFGQSTIGTYQFQDNLLADEAGKPPLKYYSSANVQITPPNGPVKYVNQYAFFGGSRMLETNDNGSYVEVTLNTTGLNNINISFTGEMLESFFGSRETGRLSLFVDYTGTGSSFGSTLLNIDLDTNSGFLGIYDADTKNVTLPAVADNNPNLLIRIKVAGINGQASGLNGQIRIDNLVITSKSPKINVFGYNTSNTLQSLPVNAPAATLYGTDFGIVITDDPNASTKTFRIRNTGAEVLQISNISFSGTNAADFSQVPNPATPQPEPVPTSPINSFPATVGIGAFREFIVKFNPSSDGKRTAQLNIYSNANPSPYSYFVEGRGATCKTRDLILSRNTMEVAQPIEGFLNATIVSGLFNKISGTSQPGRHVPLTDNQLFGQNNNIGSNFKLFKSSDNSWYTSGNAIVEFGPVDVTTEKGVYISFNLAAVGTATDTDFNNGDYVELQVLKPGTTNGWSSELRIAADGINNNLSNEDTRYNFGADATASTFYDGNNSAQIFTNGSGVPNKYAKVELKLPGSANFQNLSFRIVSNNSGNGKLWLIDDIAVYSANAVFRKWSSTGWQNAANNPASSPNKNIKALIDFPYKTVTDGDFTACECEVNPAYSVIINPGGVITLQNKLTNKGSFTIESDGNLLQVEDDVINTGQIVVERSVNDMNNLSTKMDYVYWSSPVVGQNLQSFSPGTPASNILQYKESTDYFVTSYDGAFKPAKGYAIRAEGGLADGYAKVYKFIGVPNNGDYKIAITKSPNTGATVHGYNLIGNPYPSNINFDQLFANNSSLINNTAWFWKNNSFTPNQQGQGYTGNNYMVYNGTGGSMPGVTGIVKVGQGFLVQKKNLGLDSLILKNSYGPTKHLRVFTNGTFYQRNSESKNRFWLKLISPGDVENTQLIGYIEGATDDFEIDYDAEAFGLSSNLFYSLLENKTLLIQGRASQFKIEDQIKLGVNFFQNGSYKIELEQPEGIFANGQAIYLKDKQTGTITNLSEGSYTFEANQGENTERFEIIYQSETLLVTNQKVKSTVEVYRDGDRFVIRSPKNIGMVEVYDLSGKMIAVLKADNKQVVVDASFITKGMYVLRIKMIDGEITNKKILK